jgi:hypothetical protein
MLGNSPYYWNLLRTYTEYFGALFKNIQVVRTPEGGTPTTIDVPIIYSPEEKTVARMEEFPDLNLRNVATIDPKLAYEIVAIDYDPSRQLPSLTRIITPSVDGSSAGTTYVPVPYNISFTLNIFVKNADDGNQILEQILPFFTPEFTATLMLTDGQYKCDVPVVLNSVTYRDTFEGAPADLRYLIWSISFRMKGFFFGPQKTQNTILWVDINTRPWVNNTTGIVGNTVIDTSNGSIIQSNTIYETIEVAANTTTNTVTTTITSSPDDS